MSTFCPGLLGGQREWSSSAYDPKRKITIAPYGRWCERRIVTPQLPYTKLEKLLWCKIEPGPIDQATGTAGLRLMVPPVFALEIGDPGSDARNVTATRPGVFFAGDLKRHALAVTADDGKVLLRHPLRIGRRRHVHYCAERKTVCRRRSLGRFRHSSVATGKRSSSCWLAVGAVRQRPWSRHSR